jgi:hypothetical protein
LKEKKKKDLNGVFYILSEKKKKDLNGVFYILFFKKDGFID